MQLSLLSNWIDGLATPPKDGEKVLAYTLVEDPENSTFPEINFVHEGRTIFGPTIRTFKKEFVELGWHKKIAYWQPIEPLR